MKSFHVAYKAGIDSPLYDSKYLHQNRPQRFILSSKAVLVKYLLTVQVKDNQNKIELVTPCCAEALTFMEKQKDGEVKLAPWEVELLFPMTGYEGYWMCDRCDLKLNVVGPQSYSFSKKASTVSNLEEFFETTLSLHVDPLELALNASLLAEELNDFRTSIIKHVENVSSDAEKEGIELGFNDTVKLYGKFADEILPPKKNRP